MKNTTYKYLTKYHRIATYYNDENGAITTGIWREIAQLQIIDNQLIICWKRI